MPPDPTRLLIAGDVHYNLEHSTYLVDTALEYNCDLIFQVGDFGYMPQGAEPILFLAGLSHYADTHNVPIVWLDGNHEDFAALYGGEWEIDEAGFWRILPAIRYAPRGLRWQWSDRSFLALGGAVSPDKNNRLRWEGYSRRPRTLWWEEEAITEGDLTRAMANPSPVDVMFTHDAPTQTYIPGRPPFRSHSDAAVNRDRVQQVMDRARPRLLYHGHLHVNYRYFYRGDGYETRIIGLGRDGDGPRSWDILDLETMHS